MPDSKTKTRTQNRSGRSGAVRPSLKDVAAKAGVSTATASRVLSGKGVVSAPLARKVRAVARELNFQPNRIARNLRVQETKTIGIVVPDIENPFFTSVIRGVEEVLDAAGYTMLLANCNEDPRRERTHLETLMAEAAAGVIATPMTPGTDYSALLDAGVPVVAVSRIAAQMAVDIVCVANQAGAREGVSHLIGLGHRRIALIGGPPSINTARERSEGYEDAFRAANLQVPTDLIRHADFRQEGAYQQMLELLLLDDRPTAVFTASNLMTLGALRAIHECGLRIPADLSVIGFDDLPWAASLNPPLTAVAQPTRDIGLTAAELLLDRIRQPGRPVRHVTLATRLVVRQSCAAPPEILRPRSPLRNIVAETG